MTLMVTWKAEGYWEVRPNYRCNMLEVVAIVPPSYRMGEFVPTRADVLQAVKDAAPWWASRVKSDTVVYGENLGQLLAV